MTVGILSNVKKIGIEKETFRSLKKLISSNTLRINARPINTAVVLKNENKKFLLI